MPVRIYDISKKLGLENKEVLAKAKELGIEYAAICSVDNYANGLVEKELTIGEVLSQARRNTETMTTIVRKLIERKEARSAVRLKAYVLSPP